MAGNWREKVIREMGSQVHFFEPTRIEHNKFNDFQMKEHIEWELNALNLSDKILLNFLPDAKSPISLVELGWY
ncbi:nucleoside 2-deoxyribosyltransferase domain-containing protein, partial [Pontimicrobium sp. MEBiC01747]